MAGAEQAPPVGDLVRDHLIEENRIAAETRRRLSDFQEVSVRKNEREDYEARGWVFGRELKTRVKMRKPKAHDIAFEDRVWAVFAKLQFTHLNIDRSFKLQYGAAANEAQQIDVFAADDEAVLVVECKSTEAIQPGQFKKDTEVISGQRGGVIQRLKREYPQHKIKFILATNNYTLSSAVKDRIRGADIFHIDENGVDYFLALADHLGAAAKYQLLGALFAEQKIPNLEPTVPAIEGSMGGHTYYSFSIEPARLLKMAYVLHRNQANSDLMPTYQRLIKKSRLKKVAEFVEDGGYFPNSIILNVETKGQKGKLQFDRGPKSSGRSKIGTLHLPQTYRAAYVIDGQHRLYGYANSRRAETDLIPVVAFVDLARADQLRMFMDINENQTAVPKNLQNTLNADLLWDSDDYRQKSQALRLRVAQHLGEQKTSPLFGRVVIGENAKSATRCITIEAITIGLRRSKFIGKFTKTGVEEHGSFYAADLETTFDTLTPFLEAAFGYLRVGLDTQWKLGNAQGGFVFRNNGVEAFLRLLSDVVDHVVKHDRLSPLTTTTEAMLDACRCFLDPLIEHLADLDADAGLAYRELLGSGGGMRYYRQLEQAVHAARPEFHPAGLEEWVTAQDKKFISDAREIVGEIETFLKSDVRDRLQSEFGEDWERFGVPTKVKQESGIRMVTENAKGDRPADEAVTAWDMMVLIDYREIMTYNENNWVKLFRKRYTRPDEGDKNTSRKDRTAWIVTLNAIRNRTAHVRGVVTEDEFAFLQGLKDWLILDQEDNDLPG